MAGMLFLSYCIFTVWALYHYVRPITWEIGSVLYLVLTIVLAGTGWVGALSIVSFLILIILLIHVEPIRYQISLFIYRRAGQSIPKLSKTEEEALNAGDTWLEQDIFQGKPDWHRLSQAVAPLSPEEAAFLANEVEELCRMLDDWMHCQQRDLPVHIWQYLREKGFFALVIDKAYGGKGFSARAHSDIVMKIATRSGAAAVTVMVPNSLGPGELLQYYGTDKQKSYYLPRLASGIDIPCFALTEPGAGSDATSIESKAIVVQKEIDGNSVLGLNITLNKRWITLAPVATLIGLAVNLKDPDGLLGGRGQEGITCVLIPRDIENLEIGNRHLPASQPFMNGTLRGKNIFVPIDHIIGGIEKAGQGWQMLVECLSIGRSISLPALAGAFSSISYLTSGAFSKIRRQFGVSIGEFEGIQEKLAEIAGLSYLIQATRLLTVAAVSQHKKPSSASAMTKYMNTELARITVNDAMDIHAGRAVVAGPRNYLLNAYLSLPIAITVEGANIMSRNLLIFGQGSIACHPFVREEFYALRQEDKSRFHQIIWKHIGYFLHNMAKTIGSAWTGGLLIRSPSRQMRRAYQHCTRLSYAYAWLADVALIVLGGSLKRRERLSARLADALTYLYMAMAALRLYQENSEKSSYLLHAQWSVSYCFYQTQQAMMAFCRNFPSRFLGKLMLFILFPLGQTLRHPSDKLDQNLARAMMNNNDYRDFLKQSIYLSQDPHQPIDRMEYALQMILQNQNLYDQVSDLRKYKFGRLKKKLAEKVARQEISSEVMDKIIEVERARWDAVQVDEFSFESMGQPALSPYTDTLHNPFDEA